MDCWHVFCDGSVCELALRRGRFSLKSNLRALVNLTTQKLAARFNRLGESVWRSIRYGPNDATFSNTWHPTVSVQDRTQLCIRF